MTQQVNFSMQPTYSQDFVAKLSEKKKEGLFDATLQVRDDEGIMQCFSRLIETADQYFYNSKTRELDPVIAMQNFSANQGLSGAAFGSTGGNVMGVGGASNLATMDAMDISIAAAVFSLLPYLAIEREMTSSTTNISYQDIISDNMFGKDGPQTTVLGAFQAPNIKVNLALPIESVNNIVSSAPVANGTMSFAKSIIPESVAVRVINGSGTEVATGFDKGGFIYFTPSGTGTTMPAVTANIVYKTGAMTYTVPSGYTIEAFANIDSTSDQFGKSILTVTPDYKNVTLVAVPQLLLFKDNNLKNAYLNKLNVKLAGTNASVDYGQIAIGKLITIYINYINSLVVRATLNAALKTSQQETAEGTEDVFVDLSGYWATDGSVGFAETKYDRIKQFINELHQRNLAKTGKGLTCLLVGSEGASKLSVTPDFVKSSEFSELNAMIGTYDGIPVVRHQVMIEYDHSYTGGRYCAVVGVYKDPSGTAAPIAFGEFLPVQISEKVANYFNPTQVSQSLTSYCGVVECVNQLARMGRIYTRPSVDVTKPGPNPPVNVGPITGKWEVDQGAVPSVPANGVQG